MRINAVLTWLALIATWVWLGDTYIHAQVGHQLVLDVIQHLHGTVQN